MMSFKLLFLNFFILLSLKSCCAKKCQCGKIESSSSARIFKGKDASVNQFPWQIYKEIYFADESGKEKMSRGGGTLISKKHVLTTAHSFFDAKGR